MAEATVIQTATLADMVGQMRPRRVLSLDEFAERLHSEISRSRRFKLKICCLLVCVPGADSVIEANGEEWWEALIAEVGRTVAGCLRESDVVCRYAIDAFAVLLTHTDLRDAPIVAEKTRDRLQSRPFVNNGKSVQVSPCVGMSQFPDVEVESAIDFMNAAENALLSAEQQGPGTIAEGSRL